MSYQISRCLTRNFWSLSTPAVWPSPIAATSTARKAVLSVLVRAKASFCQQRQAACETTLAAQCICRHAPCASFQVGLTPVLGDWQWIQNYSCLAWHRRQCVNASSFRSGRGLLRTQSLCMGAGSTNWKPLTHTLPGPDVWHSDWLDHRGP